MLVRKKQSHACNQILRQSYEYEHYLACLDWKQLDAAAQAAFDGIGADGALTITAVLKRTGSLRNT